MDDRLIERLKLLLAWKTRGGPMPEEPCPNIFKTVSEALDRIQSQQSEIASLRGALEMLHATVGDLRKGFSTNVNSSRWVEQVQAMIDEALTVNATT